MGDGGATNTMDAIKKKMQAMKSEKETANDRAEQLEQQLKECEEKVNKVCVGLMNKFCSQLINFIWLARGRNHQFAA